MGLGWFFGAPDRVLPNDPCPKLSRAARRKCTDGLITEILAQLRGGTDEDRCVDEDTSDFLPAPAWGSVKINFYRAYPGSTMKSSAFKERKRNEIEQYSVEFPDIIKCNVDQLGGRLGGLGSWCGFLGSFASVITAMVASDPSNKWLRTVRYVHSDPQSIA